MKTRDFLRRYAYVYLYVICAFLGAAALFRGAVETAGEGITTQQRPAIVIDAGHGGMDGGTTSCTGVLESGINLDIARRLEAMLGLLGYDTVMTRTTADSIAKEGQTIRQQKQSDLRNRAKIVNGQPSAILVSIHQNHFPDSKYWGPHVYYAPDSVSQALAQAMQSGLNRCLAPKSNRTCKAADGVWLMQHIQCPGILIECGFLSNPTEEALLREPEYQKKLCGAITAALVNYIEEFSSL